jgi:hypothetical protein
MPHFENDLAQVPVSPDTCYGQQVTSPGPTFTAKCVRRTKLATDSGVKLATDSGLKLATYSGGKLATFRHAPERVANIAPE